MTASRTDSLQRLQSVTELHEFLQFITDDGKSHTNRSLVVVVVVVLVVVVVVVVGVVVAAAVVVAVTSRTDSLQRLQGVTELHEFLQFITDDGKSHINTPLVVVVVVVLVVVVVVVVVTSRTDSLQRLQGVTELHEFLQFITDDGKSNTNILLVVVVVVVVLLVLLVASHTNSLQVTVCH